MPTKLTNLFFLEVEEPGDYLFQLSGIVVFYSNNKFEVYSNSVNHNRFRAAIQKFSLLELEKGVVWRGAEYRLTGVDEKIKQTGWENPKDVPTLLRRAYTQNPRHLFFLKKYLKSQ